MSGKEMEVVINSEEGSISTAKKRGLLQGLRHEYREYLAEFLGTAILVLFGDGVIAQVTFNKAATGSAFLSVNIGWALGVICAIIVAGPVSGSNINPAVTIAFALFRKLPWKKVPGYIISQILGAFFAAFLLFIIYLPAIDEYDGGIRASSGLTATAGIFSTFPNPHASQTYSFIAEAICTGTLLLVIQGVTDPRNKAPTYMVAVLIGSLLGAIGICIGWMTGYAINPARDFGPRLFTAIAGWGIAPFTASNYYFWIPIVAPVVGAIGGVALYDCLIDPEPESEL